MTQNDLNHIFERFWRGSNTHNIAGIGIGMALVHEIINFHRGHIEITSEPGIGTEVVLWLNTHAI
jgi:signal transduction histidine kinase